MMKTISTFFCILLPSLLFCQEIIDTSKISNLMSKAESFDIITEKDSALLYYDGVFSYIKKNFSSVTKQDSLTNNQIVVHLSRLLKTFNEEVFFDNQRSIEVYKFSKAFFNEKIDEYTKSTIINNIGKTYVRLELIDSAIVMYRKALDIKLKAPLKEKNASSIPITYNNIAVCYHRKGDYERALVFLKKGLLLNENPNKRQNINLDLLLNNIGGTELTIGNYANALDYFKRVLSLNLSLGKEKQIGNSYTNIAMTYLKLESYELALANFKLARNIFIKRLGVLHPWTCTTYRGIGDALLELGKFEDALKAFDLSIKGRIKAYGNKNFRVANSILSKAILYSRMGDFENATHFNNEALKAINILDLKKLDIKEISSFPIFFDIIEHKFSFPDSITNPIETKCNCENTFEAYRYFKKTVDNKPSILRTKKRLQKIFKYCFQNEINLYKNTNDKKHLKYAFEISERNKSSILLEDIRFTNSFEEDNILNPMLIKEREIKFKLLKCKQSIAKIKDTETLQNKEKRKKLEDEIFKYEKDLDELIVLFKENHSKYYDLKYNDEVSNLEDIQQNLKKSTTLIEYFIGEERIFAFIIDKENFEIVEMPLNKSFTRDVSRLVKSVYSYHLDSKRSISKKTYSDTLSFYSYKVYNSIFAPIESEIKLNSKLVIIPDGVLGYLPFDLLIKNIPEESNSFGIYNYLIKDYQISYSYSISLLQEVQRKETAKQKGSFIAFAPSFNSKIQTPNYISEIRSGLGKLKYNIKEVKAIQEKIGGDLFIEEKATKENFVEVASNYQIIHLSTHGKANDKIGDHSYLAFYKPEDSLNYELLYNRELYNLNLNTEMVVLSACETGIGELQQGEGIVSLAMGFSYAGAKSMVTSLWSVNDKKTNELMSSFYEYIKKGEPKDFALQQAKLDFIKKYKVDAHPFYWAAFIPIGDMSPIELSSGFNWRIWGVGAFLLLVFFILFKKNKN